MLKNGAMKLGARCKAFTLLELLVICGVVAILGFLFLSAQRTCHPSPKWIRCVNNLKEVGLAFRIFAVDNNDRFPWQVVEESGGAVTNLEITGYFLWIADELSTPNRLYCPGDESKERAESFTNFTRKNISYFASLSARETIPESVLAGDRHLMVNSSVVKPGLLVLATNDIPAWTREIHGNQGNIAMGDGSVRWLRSAGLRQALKESGVAPNLWLVP